ncbi:ferredoxin [Pseudonocardia sp. GCM10023141]|uniref:ferredoxin n=1 Tax=Pseudonocardia sp. GCM10023141 TaxID=3252653 RepID=UPI0036185843
MITIKADRDVCQGYGNCVLADSTLFDIDDDGLVVLSSHTVAPDGLAAAKRAAYDCPSEAITVVEND